MLQKYIPQTPILQTVYILNNRLYRWSLKKTKGIVLFDRKINNKNLRNIDYIWKNKRITINSLEFTF